MGTGPPLGVERKHLSYFWMNACMAVGFRCQALVLHSVSVRPLQGIRSYRPLALGARTPQGVATPRNRTI